MELNCESYCIWFTWVSLFFWPQTMIWFLSSVIFSILLITSSHFHFSLYSCDIDLCVQEGIKLLCTWLEGERSVAFCKFLGQNTAKLKPNEVPHCKIDMLHNLSMGLEETLANNCESENWRVFYFIVLFLLLQLIHGHFL